MLRGVGHAELLESIQPLDPGETSLPRRQERGTARISLATSLTWCEALSPRLPGLCPAFQSVAVTSLEEALRDEGGASRKGPLERGKGKTSEQLCFWHGLGPTPHGCGATLFPGERYLRPSSGLCAEVGEALAVAGGLKEPSWGGDSFSTRGAGSFIS